MQNEKLQKWALIAEIISGFAVVLSLIFVGLEIRQSSDETSLNTRAIEINSYQDLIAQILLLNVQFIGNPELSELWASSSDCEEVESRANLQQLSRFYASVVRHADMAYHQYEQGLITEERLDSALAIFIEHIRTNYYFHDRWMVPVEKKSPLRLHVDKLLEESGGAHNPCPNLIRNNQI